jgi:TrmH family RNA methyltransferase
MIKKIASAQNPLVKHLVRLRHNRDYRYEHHSVVVEGKKIITELCKNNVIKHLLILDESQLPPEARPLETWLVTEEIMHKISGVQSSEGILAEVVMPNPSSLSGKKRLIALDGVNDPGNLGTLLRTALALGWEGAFIVNDSCDPFNEKAIRSARGAIFRLPFNTGSWQELQQLAEANQMLPIAADMHGEPVSSFKHQGGILLVLSNEAHGLSPQADPLCRKVSVPMPGSMESLNVAVAGGILMFALMEKQA